ncbi:hypothetical protein BC827DRAFT_1122226 [Russula dissimulans]|nr:hypothetical protein BC827DRAFT_1122226 [Russula dissimulans]
MVHSLHDDPRDPRDPSLESTFTLPDTWRTQDSVDGLATSGLFLAGLIMVTRNRFLAWPSLLLGLSAWLNQHPLRTKEAGTPPIGNLMHVPPNHLVSRLRC